MGDFSVKITEVDNVSTVPVDITAVPPVEISSIDKIDKIAPIAVHIKELNQVDPLLIEIAADRSRRQDRSAIR